MRFAAVTATRRPLRCMTPVRAEVVQATPQTERTRRTNKPLAGASALGAPVFLQLKRNDLTRMLEWVAIFSGIDRTNRSCDWPDRFGLHSASPSARGSRPRIAHRTPASPAGVVLRRLRLRERMRRQRPGCPAP